MITFKMNMVATQDFYLLILIVWCIKLKLKKFIKNSKDKDMFGLAIILLSQNVMIIQAN